MQVLPQAFPTVQILQQAKAWEAGKDVWLIPSDCRR
jgi:hypothetical protein